MRLIAEAKEDPKSLQRKEKIDDDDDDKVITTRKATNFTFDGRSGEQFLYIWINYW